MKVNQIKAESLRIGHMLPVRQFKGLADQLDSPGLRAVMSVAKHGENIKFELSPDMDGHPLDEPGTIIEVPASETLRVCDLQSTGLRQVKMNEGNGVEALWNIAFISTRFGGLDLWPTNLKAVSEAVSLRPRLRQMLNELTYECNFAFKLDNLWGLLYESEHGTQESEADLMKDYPKELAKLKTNATMLQEVYAFLPELKKAFPKVRFGLPEENECAQSRICIWAFSPVGVLSQKEREDLCMAMMKLSLHRDEQDLMTA